MARVLQMPLNRETFFKQSSDIRFSLELFKTLNMFMRFQLSVGPLERRAGSTMAVFKVMDSMAEAETIIDG